MNITLTIHAKQVPVLIAHSKRKPKVLLNKVVKENKK